MSVYTLLELSHAISQLADHVIDISLFLISLSSFSSNIFHYVIIVFSNKLLNLILEVKSTERALSLHL